LELPITVLNINQKWKIETIIYSLTDDQIEEMLDEGKTDVFNDCILSQVNSDAVLRNKGNSEMFYKTSELVGSFKMYSLSNLFSIPIA
jgi:hypothetical protein